MVENMRLGGELTETESARTQASGLERRTYSFTEAIGASTDYFKGDRFAADVWLGKYSLKDSQGNIYEKTPDDMHRRLAREFARVEGKYANPLDEEKIYSLLKDFKYVIPQGSPQAGIGNNFQVSSLSNCFVIGNGSDSYGGIMRIDEEQVQLMKRRAGVGHDISHLRPSGSPVANTARTSTGMATFMERYSNSTREVAQGGRRGALMLTSSIRHPNIEEFIDAKMTPGKITGANVSIKTTDDFMRAVAADQEYTLKFPVDSENPTITRKIRARDLWNKIIHNAWKSAEPGMLFWDTVIRESVPDCYSNEGFTTTATNPCGEIPKCPYDSCRLLAMNLYNYVENPFTPNARFNMQLYKEHVGYAQRLMDDLVDLELEKVDQILAKIESDPEPEEIKFVERELWNKIREKALKGRRTGLGITGEGDMLAALGMRYGSEEAINFSADIVHKTQAIEAYRASVQLAEERGAFPIYDHAKEEDNPFINRIREAEPELYERMKKSGRRNIAILTIAPAGSISIEGQVSSGIQNAFAVAYERKRKINPSDLSARVDSTDQKGDSWQHYKIVHHKFIDWVKASGEYNPDEVRKIAEDSINKDSPTQRKSIEELEKIVAKSPFNKTLSSNVDWVSQVKLQGRVQKWVDHSISVTVNLPSDATEETVEKVYQTAWDSGCKGITVYREESREGVLTTGKASKEGGLANLFVPGTHDNPEELPPILPALRMTQRTPKGPMHTFVPLDPYTGRPLETFTNVARAGAEEAAEAEGFGRLGSLILRSGGKLKSVVKQLINLGSIDNHMLAHEGTLTTLPQSFGMTLKKYDLIARSVNIGDVLTGKVNFWALDYAASEAIKQGESKLDSNMDLTKDPRKTSPQKSSEKPLAPTTDNIESQQVTSKSSLSPCPDCGGKVVSIGGCPTCTKCNWSRCG